jgi:O-antigen biosynthesis protein WbqV
MAALNASLNKRHFRLRHAKNTLVVMHDGISSAAALLLALALLERPVELLDYLTSLGLLAVATSMASMAALWALGVFSSRWRLASLFDFLAILRASILVSLALLLASALYPHAGLSSIDLRSVFIFCMFQCAFLIGGRVAYRVYRLLLRRKVRELEDIDAVVFVGALKEFDAALRAAEQGLLKNVFIAAGLIPRGAAEAKRLRGVQVFGDIDKLEACCASLRLGGFSVTAASLTERPEELRALQVNARRLGLQILRLQPVDLGQGAATAPVNFSDFFLRHEIRVDHERIGALVRGKSVLITGGGGSIGGEIARIIAAHGAREIIIVEISEQALQSILSELQEFATDCAIHGQLADVRDVNRLRRVVARATPDIVVHSAALKHVDLAETNWQEAVKTNVFGSLNVLQIAAELDVPTLVNISTDKAVDPVGMLGFTKRCSEILVSRAKETQGRRVLSVRFGNVLGSSGSVVPIFLRQIASGGPVTVTDPAMTRYFMSIREAAELVLVSCSLVANETQNARVRSSTFLLDMGRPVRIVDLAEQLIEWSGWTPHQDIKIVYTGLRPGERLHESLIAADECATPSHEAGVFQLETCSQFYAHVEPALINLAVALEQDDKDLALSAMQAMVERHEPIAIKTIGGAPA